MSIGKETYLPCVLGDQIENATTGERLKGIRRQYLSRLALVRVVIPAGRYFSKFFTVIVPTFASLETRRNIDKKVRARGADEKSRNLHWC